MLGRPHILNWDISKFVIQGFLQHPADDHRPIGGVCGRWR
jgi:hypothetical protein